VISAARLECGEPAAEAGELVWRQVGNSFGDFFDFHVAQYSTVCFTAAYRDRGCVGTGALDCGRYGQTGLLPRYRQVLAIAPVNADDLEKILSIKAEFFSALPSIRALCEHSLLENVEDKEAVRYLLSGIAAADGLLSIARLLNYGDEGLLQCTSCSQDYEFIRFGERMAIYAGDPTSAVRPADDKGLSDYKEGAPSRADGFVVPIAENNVLDARTASLLSLAKHAPSPEPALLLRHFVGSFVCGKCGIKGPMHSP
jgi:hypothetical protein